MTILHLRIVYSGHEGVCMSKEVKEISYCVVGVKLNLIVWWFKLE